MVDSMVQKNPGSVICFSFYHGFEFLSFVKFGWHLTSLWFGGVCSLLHACPFMLWNHPYVACMLSSKCNFHSHIFGP